MSQETTSTPDLDNTTVGQQIHAPFVLIHKERKSIKKGKREMFKIELRNETGAIEAPIWEEAMPEWEDIQPGQPVMIKGRVTEGFRDGPNELKVMEVKQLETPHPVMDSMNPVYPGDVEKLEERFEWLVDEIDDPGIQLFVRRFFETGCPMEQFRTCPAALRHHHAYIHGLMEHTVEMTEMALDIADKPGIREHVNRDVLIAGGLIHDAGKVREYVWDGEPIGMNMPDANLYGHITVGPIQATRTFERHREELREAGFTSEQLQHLIHMQISHHGERQYGSPTEPATLAGKILHQADLASSKVRKMAKIVREHEVNHEGLIKSGDREYWKGIVPDPASRAETRGQERVQQTLEEETPEQPETGPEPPSPTGRIR